MAAIVLIWQAALTSWILAAVTIFALTWLALNDRILIKEYSLPWKIVAMLAPAIAKFLSWIQPLTGRAAVLFEKRRSEKHTNLHELDDLFELLEKQIGQTDNRIPSADLFLTHKALHFSKKTVGSVMVPFDKIKVVMASDPIGPLLMDELHASGYKWFPVVEKIVKVGSPKITGILYLKDVVGHSGSGTVKDLAKTGIHYINESQNLKEALVAFTQTGNQLLIVLNNFEEISGVLSIEDVLKQILDEQPAAEFENYDDKKAVAALDAVEVEQNTQSEAEVVE